MIFKKFNFKTSWNSSFGSPGVGSGIDTDSETDEQKRKRLQSRLELLKAEISPVGGEFPSPQQKSDYLAAQMDLQRFDSTYVPPAVPAVPDAFATPPRKTMADVRQSFTDPDYRQRRLNSDWTESINRGAQAGTGRAWVDSADVPKLNPSAGFDGSTPFTSTWQALGDVGALITNPSMDTISDPAQRNRIRGFIDDPIRASNELALGINRQAVEDDNRNIIKAPGDARLGRGLYGVAGMDTSAGYLGRAALGNLGTMMIASAIQQGNSDRLETAGRILESIGNANRIAKDLDKLEPNKTPEGAGLVTTVVDAGMNSVLNPYWWKTEMADQIGMQLPLWIATAAAVRAGKPMAAPLNPLAVRAGLLVESLATPLGAWLESKTPATVVSIGRYLGPKIAPTYESVATALISAMTETLLETAQKGSETLDESGSIDQARAEMGKNFYQGTVALMGTNLAEDLIVGKLIPFHVSRSINNAPTVKKRNSLLRQLTVRAVGETAELAFSILKEMTEEQLQEAIQMNAGGSLAGNLYQGVFNPDNNQRIRTAGVEGAKFALGFRAAGAVSGATNTLNALAGTFGPNSPQAIIQQGIPQTQGAAQASFASVVDLFNETLDARLEAARQNGLSPEEVATEKYNYQNVVIPEVLKRIGLDMTNAASIQRTLQGVENLDPKNIFKRIQLAGMFGEINNIRELLNTLHPQGTAGVQAIIEDRLGELARLSLPEKFQNPSDEFNAAAGEGRNINNVFDVARTLSNELHARVASRTYINLIKNALGSAPVSDDDQGSGIAKIVLQRLREGLTSEVGPISTLLREIVDAGLYRPDDKNQINAEIWKKIDVIVGNSSNGVVRGNQVGIDIFVIFNEAQRELGNDIVSGKLKISDFSKENIKKLVAEYFRDKLSQTIIHEIGHTLGIEDNNRSSSEAYDAILKKYLRLNPTEFIGNEGMAALDALASGLVQNQEFLDDAKEVYDAVRSRQFTISEPFGSNRLAISSESIQSRNLMGSQPAGVGGGERPVDTGTSSRVPDVGAGTDAAAPGMDASTNVGPSVPGRPIGPDAGTTDAGTTDAGTTDAGTTTTGPVQQSDANAGTGTRSSRAASTGPDAGTTDEQDDASGIRLSPEEETAAYRDLTASRQTIRSSVASMPTPSGTVIDGVDLRNLGGNRTDRFGRRTALSLADFILNIDAQSTGNSIGYEPDSVAAAVQEVIDKATAQGRMPTVQDFWNAETPGAPRPFDRTKSKYFQSTALTGIPHPDLYKFLLHLAEKGKGSGSWYLNVGQFLTDYVQKKLAKTVEAKGVSKKDLNSIVEELLGYFGRSGQETTPRTNMGWAFQFLELRLLLQDTASTATNPKTNEPYKNALDEVVQTNMAILAEQDRLQDVVDKSKGPVVVDEKTGKTAIKDFEWLSVLKNISKSPSSDIKTIINSIFTNQFSVPLKFVNDEGKPMLGHIYKYGNIVKINESLKGKSFAQALIDSKGITFADNEQLSLFIENVNEIYQSVVNKKLLNERVFGTMKPSKLMKGLSQYAPNKTDIAAMGKSGSAPVEVALDFWTQGGVEIESNMKLAQYYGAIRESLFNAFTMFSVPDRWMFKSFGVIDPDKQSTASNAQASEFLMTIVADIASKLDGVTPTQLQAMIWTGLRMSLLDPSSTEIAMKDPYYVQSGNRQPKALWGSSGKGGTWDEKKGSVVIQDQNGDPWSIFSGSRSDANSAGEIADIFGAEDNTFFRKLTKLMDSTIRSIGSISGKKQSIALNPPRIAVTPLFPSDPQSRVDSLARRFPIRNAVDYIGSGPTGVVATGDARSRGQAGIEATSPTIIVPIGKVRLKIVTGTNQLEVLLQDSAISQTPLDKMGVPVQKGQKDVTNLQRTLTRFPFAQRSIEDSQKNYVPHYVVETADHYEVVLIGATPAYARIIASFLAAKAGVPTAQVWIPRATSNATSTDPYTMRRNKAETLAVTAPDDGVWTIKDAGALVSNVLQPGDQWTLGVGGTMILINPANTADLGSIADALVTVNNVPKESINVTNVDMMEPVAANPKASIRPYMQEGAPNFLQVFRNNTGLQSSRASDRPRAPLMGFPRARPLDPQGVAPEDYNEIIRNPDTGEASIWEENGKWYASTNDGDAREVDPYSSYERRRMRLPYVGERPYDPNASQATAPTLEDDEAKERMLDSIRRTRKYYEDQGLPIPEKLKAEMDSITSGEGEGQAIRSSRATTDPKRVSIGRLRKTVDPLGLAMDLSSANFMTLLESMSANGNQLDNLPFISWSLPAQFGSVFAEQTGIGMTKVLRNLSVPSVVGRQPTQAEVSNYIKELQERFLKEQLGAVPATGSMARNIYGALHQTDKLYYIPMLANFIGEHVVVMRRKGTWIEKVEDPNTKTKVPKVGIEDNVRIIFGRNVTEQDARAGAAFLGYVTVQDAMGLWRPLSAISIDQFDGLMDVLGKHVSVKRENNETHEAAQKRLLEIIRRNTQSSDPLADAFAMLDFETNPVHLLSINAAIKAALPGGVAPSGQGARTGSNLWHNIKPKNKDFSALLKYFKISNPNINVIGMKTGENPTEPETMKRFSQELADLGFEGIELDTSGRFVVIIDYNPFKINEDMTFGEVAKTLVINHIKYAEALKKIYEYGYAAPNDMFVGVWDGQLVAVTNAPLDGAWWADGKAGDPDKTFGTYIQAWGRRHPDGAKQLRGQIEGVIGRRRLAFLSSTVSRQPRVAGVIEDYGLADLQESIIQWTQKNVIPLEGSGIENFDPVRQRERGSELGGDTSRVLIRNSRATVRPDTDTLIGSISKQTPASMGGRAFPPSVRSATGEMISSDWGMLTPESPPMIQSSRAEITDDMRTKSKNEWAYTGDQWIRDFGQGIWGRVIRRANVSPEVFESGQDVAHAYRWGVGIENPESNALVAQKIANMSVYGAEDHLPNLSVRGAWEEAGTAAQAQRSAQQRMSFLAGIVADAEVALRGLGIEKFLERYIREQGKINEILYHIDSFYSSPPQQFVRKISPSNVMYTPEAFNFTDSDFQMAKNMIVYGVRMATQPDFQGSYGNTLPVARPFFSRPQFADDFVFIADILDKKLGKKVKLLTPEEMKSYDMFADLEDIQNEKGKLTIDTDVMQGNHGIAESYKMWNNLPESSPQKASDFWTLWDIYQKRSNIAESYTRRGMLRGMTGRGAIRSSLASAQSTGPNMLRHFANPDGTPLKGVVVDADGNVRATRLSDNVKMNELLNAGVYNGPAFPAVSAREGFQNYRDAIMLGLDPSIDKSKAVGDFIMVTGDSSSKMFEDAMFAATGRPVHVLSATNPHTGAQLVVQTDFAGSGNMSEHLPLPTYSKPFAQTYPDDATDNGPGVSRAVTGPTSGFYVLHDTGAGMSPVTIATTLMHAFASGKEKTGPNTGSSGGFGIGIGSVLSAAEHVEVMTTWRDPATGKLVRTTLTGSGAEFSDPTVGLRPLVMSSDVEGDGLPPHPDPHRELALQQIARAEANLHGGEAAAYVGLGSGNQRRYRWRGRTETGKVLNFNEADPDRATGWHPEYTRVNMTQGAHVGAFASWTESVASLVRGYAWVDGEQVPINAPNGSVMATVRSYYDETRKRFMAFGQDMSSWSQYQKLRSIDPYLQGMGPYTVDNVPARTRPAGLDDVLRGATALEGALLTYDKSMQQMAGNPYIIEDTRDPSRPKTMGVTRTMAEWAQIALQRDPSLMGRYMQGRPNSLEDPSYWGTGTTITIWPGHLVDISSVDRRDPAQSFQDPAVNKKIAQAIRIGYNLVFTNKDPFYKGVTFVTQRVGEQNQGHTFNLGEGRENRQQSIMGYQAYLDYTNPLLYQRDTLTPTTQVDVYTNETYQSWPDRSGHWLVSGLHAQQNPQWNATTLFPQLYPPNMLEEIITYDGRTGAETPTTLPADHLIGGVDSQNLSSYSRNAYRRFINGTSMVMLNPNRNWEKEAQGTMVSPAAGQGVSFTDMNGVQAGTFDVSYKDTNEKDSSTTLILSNGSYQYSETDGSNTAKERPDVIVVDVHSTASPSSPEYPFVLSRDQTKDWFARQPREWVTQNIDAAILQGHKQSVWDSLSSGFGINGFDNAATSIGDPLMLLDAGKTFDPSITQGLSQERWIIKFAQVLQEMSKEFSLTLEDLSAEYKVSETQDISRNTEYFNFIFAGFTMQKDLVAVNYNTRAVSPQNWYVNSFGVSTNVPRYVMVNPFVTMAQAVDRTSGSGAASITNRTMTLGLLTDFIAQARDAFAQAPAALSTKELIQYWKQEQAQADANFRAIRRQTGQTPIGHSSGGFLRKVREFGIQLQYALWHEVTHQGESGHGSGFGRALQQNLEAIRHIDTVEKQSDDLLETLLDNDAEILVQIAQFIIDNPDVLYKKDDPNVRMNLLIPGSTPQAVANANPQGVIDVEWRESSGDRPDSARGSTNDRGALDGQDNEYGREDSERGTSLRSSRGQMGSDFSADTGLYEGGNGGRNFERNGSGVSGDTTGIRSSRVGRFLQPYKTPPPTPIGPLPAVALSPLGQQLYDSNLLPIQGPEIDARIAAGKFGPDIKAGQVPPEWIATSALWGNTKSKPVKGELVKRGGERVGSFWYMNTLAAPAGAMVDIISNALNIPAMLLRETNAMMIERMAGVPREQRTASLEKLYGAVSSMWSSTMNASRDALDAFAQGMEPIRGEQPRGFTSGKKGMFLETVGRTRIAADIFVNNLTLQMAIHAIAHREAGKTEKFGTPAYKSLVLAHIQKMSEELANGTPEWVETWDEIEDAYFSQPKAQAPGSRYPYGPAYPRTASDPNARPIKQKAGSYEVRKQVSQSSEGLAGEALRQARENVFQERAPHLISLIADQRGVAKGVLQAMIPFYRTIATIGYRGAVNLTPMGLPGIAYDAATAAITDSGPSGRLNSRNPEEHFLVRQPKGREYLPMSQRLGYQMIGMTVAMMASAAFLAGMATGSGPDDEEEKKAMMAEGWRPWSFLTKDGKGKKTYTAIMNVLGPFSYPVVFGIAWSETHQKSGVLDPVAFGAFAASMWDFTFTQSGLKSYKEAFDALEGGRDMAKMKQAVSRYLSGFVPYVSLGRAINNAIDDTVRDPRSVVIHYTGNQNMDEWISYFTQTAQEGIPGMSSNLPPKRNEIGQIERRSPGQTGARAFFPFQSTEDQRRSRGQYRYSRSTSKAEDVITTKAVSAVNQYERDLAAGIRSTRPTRDQIIRSQYDTSDYFETLRKKELERQRRQEVANTPAGFR